MSHQPRPPWSGWSGPRDAKLVFCAEAWGETEDRLRKPLSGESGAEFFRMLWQAAPDLAPELAQECLGTMRYGDAWVGSRESWLEAAGIGLTNVLAFRPPGNRIPALCGKRAEVGKDYPWPAISTESPGYLREEYLPELDRLGEELAFAKPNLVVALGNVACWALLRNIGITGIRGSVGLAGEWTSIPGTKVLPTYHPAAILRQWPWRVVTVADFIKAVRESQFPELRRPVRYVMVNPSIEEVEAWTAQTIAKSPEKLAWDTETLAGQIQCISFARSPSEALVVPFVDFAKPDWSYWPDPSLEIRAWDCVERLLGECCGLGQNLLYDLQYITRVGIRPRGDHHDTMLLHHAIFPELPKGLGFLGSVYTNEISWKLLRRQKHKEEGEKKDE